MTSIAYPMPVYLPRRKRIITPGEWLREKIAGRTREHEDTIALAVAHRAVGALAGANSGNLATVGLPVGHALNDILILLAIQHDNVASTVAGYTLIGSQVNGANMTMRIFAKRDGGSEAAPALTHAAGGTVHAWIQAVSGVDAGLTVAVPGAGSVFRDVQFATGSGTGNLTITIPAVSAVAGDLLDAISGGDTTDTSGVGSNNWTAPSSPVFTERVDTGRVGATASNISELATVAAGAGGATSSSLVNSFGGTMNWIGCQLVISAAAAGGATEDPYPQVGGSYYPVEG